MLLRDDLVRAKEWKTTVPAQWRGTHENYRRWTSNTKSAIARIPVFEITNVAEYFYLGTDQEHWDLFSDFPRPMPPFEEMWLEFTLPPKTFSEGKVKDLPCHSAFRRVGCHLRCVDTESAALSAADRRLLRNDGGINPDIRYLATAGMYLEARTGEFASMCYVTFGLTVHGEPVPFRPDGQKLSYFFPAADARNMHDVECGKVMTEIGGEACSLMYPVVLAMSLVNCRNVSTRVVWAEPRLLAKHARNGVTVTARHHIIEIQPMIRKVKDETAEAGYSRRAAVVVRGHFKNYSEGKGLFGQHKGMFWWHQKSGGLDASGVEYRLKHRLGPLDTEWPIPGKV